MLLAYILVGHHILHEGLLQWGHDGRVVVLLVQTYFVLVAFKVVLGYDMQIDHFPHLVVGWDLALEIDDKLQSFQLFVAQRVAHIVLVDRVFDELSVILKGQLLPCDFESASQNGRVGVQCLPHPVEKG